MNTPEMSIRRSAVFSLTAVLALGLVAFGAAPVSADPPDEVRSNARNRTRSRTGWQNRQRDRNNDRRYDRDDDYNYDDRGRYSTRGRDYDRDEDLRHSDPYRYRMTTDIDLDNIPNEQDRDMDGDGISNERDREPRVFNRTSENQRRGWVNPDIARGRGYDDRYDTRSNRDRYQRDRRDRNDRNPNWEDYLQRR